MANSCYPATWGQPVWRRQPFATHVAIPPSFDIYIKTFTKSALRLIQCFLFVFLWLFFANKQTSLLFIVGELVREGSVTVAVDVSDG